MSHKSSIGTLPCSTSKRHACPPSRQRGLTDLPAKGNWERHQPYSDGPKPSNDGRKHLFAGNHRRKISEIPQEDLSKRLKRNTSSHSGAAADGTAVDDLSSGLVQHDPFEQSRGPGPPVFSTGGHQEPVRLITNSNPGNYLSIYYPLNEASSTNSTDPYGADWPPVISRPSKAPINSSQNFHPYQPFPFNQEYPQFNEQAYSGNPLVQGAIEAVSSTTLLVSFMLQVR